MPGKKPIVSLAVLALLFAAVPASATEQTPQTYKEQVEPICKRDTEANEKILKGVREKVKSGKLDAAAKQFSRAAKALKHARAQLLQVPKPSEDAARLTKWLGYVKTEVELFEATSRKLAKGQANSAQKLVVRLISNARLANNQVLDYQFRYCRLQPSKFI